MSNRNLFGIIIVLGIVGSIVYWASINRPSPTSTPPFPVIQTQTPQETLSGEPKNPSIQPTQIPQVITQTIASAKEKLKTFTIEAKNYSFTPNEIKVKKGMTITIQLENKEGTHDFVLDEFNVKSKRLNAGEKDIVSFIVDKTGTFEYYCSVGNHRQMGMKGKLIVE